MPPESKIEDEEEEELEAEASVKGGIQPDDMELEDEDDPIPDWAPQEEETSPTPAEGDKAPEKPEAEPKEKETKEPGEPKDKAAPEPEPIEIDGKPVARKELESAWRDRRRTLELTAKAKREIEDAQLAVEDIANNPSKALLAIYTKQFQGNRQLAKEKLGKIAYAILEPWMKRELMKPEEKQAFDARMELQELEEEIETRRRRIAEEEQAREQKTLIEAIDRSIDSALAEMKPTNPKLLRPYIYTEIRQQMAAGQKPDALAATKAVIEHFEAQTRALLDNLDPDSILKRKPDLLEKVRKADVTKLQQARTPPSTKTPSADSRPTTGERRGKRKPTAEQKEAYRVRNGRFF